MNIDYQKRYEILIKKYQTRPHTGPGEWHHIIPVSCGGSNETENMVKLPRQSHWFAHKLLFLANPKNYSLAQAFVNMGRVVPEGTRRKSLAYAKARKNIADAVSKKHTGTVVVKDKETGEMIGRVPKTHPKYKSGEWVFYQKGVKKKDGNYPERWFRHIRENSTKENNGRWSGISDEEIIEGVIEFYEEKGFFVCKQFDEWYAETKGKKLPALNSATPNRFKEYDGKNVRARFMSAVSDTLEISKEELKKMSFKYRKPKNAQNKES